MKNGLHVNKNGTQEWWVEGELIEEDHPFAIALKRNRLFAKWKRGELTEDEQILIKLSM